MVASIGHGTNPIEIEKNRSMFRPSAPLLAASVREDIWRNGTREAHEQGRLGTYRQGRPAEGLRLQAPQHEIVQRAHNRLE